ncbi:MAG: hypothetical protein HY909_10475 [Deltaproteobacteria bacterium]|nr:hypothetical protein [Deltaproteobacteria bacterium]
MGLRVAAFALAFNALFILSRLTIGALAWHRWGAFEGLAVALLAPAALLGVATRLVPWQRRAFLAVALGSVALGSALVG